LAADDPSTSPDAAHALLPMSGQLNEALVERSHGGVCRNGSQSLHSLAISHHQQTRALCHARAGSPMASVTDLIATWMT
jgi:hypothetical protein